MSSVSLFRGLKKSSTGTNASGVRKTAGSSTSADKYREPAPSPDQESAAKKRVHFSPEEQPLLIQIREYEAEERPANELVVSEAQRETSSSSDLSVTKLQLSEDVAAPSSASTTASNRRSTGELEPGSWVGATAASSAAGTARPPYHPEGYLHAKEDGAFPRSVHTTNGEDFVFHEAPAFHQRAPTPARVRAATGGSLRPYRWRRRNDDPDYYGAPPSQYLVSKNSAGAQNEYPLYQNEWWREEWRESQGLAWAPQQQSVWRDDRPLPQGIPIVLGPNGQWRLFESNGAAASAPPTRWPYAASSNRRWYHSHLENMQLPPTGEFPSEDEYDEYVPARQRYRRPVWPAGTRY